MPRLIVDLEGTLPSMDWSEQAVGQALISRVRVTGRVMLRAARCLEPGVEAILLAGEGRNVTAVIS